MSKSMILLASLIVLSLFAVQISSVLAQKLTILSVQYPANIVYGSSGSTSVTVNVQYAPSGENLTSYGFAVELWDRTRNDTLIQGSDVSQNGSPRWCQTPDWNGQGASGIAMCPIVPIDSHESGSESVVFSFNSSRAPSAPVWSLGVTVYVFVLYSGLPSTHQVWNNFTATVHGAPVPETSSSNALVVLTFTIVIVLIAYTRNTRTIRTR